jgi:LemA protein
VNYEEKIEALKAKNVLDEEQAERLSGVLNDEPMLDETMDEVEKSHFVRWVSVFVLAVVIGFGILYNGLVNKQESVNVAWSQVESTMQRKLDLLPNLVKVVKAYAKHEKELLTEITSLRAKAQDTLVSKDAGKLALLNTKLNVSVMKLFAVAENYPDIKSSEQFLQLQAQIEGSENRINITRMMFNDAVGEYNGAIRKMPQRLIASVGGFEKRAYFKAEESAHKKLEIGL